jgi:hypothetical protein
VGPAVAPAVGESTPTTHRAAVGGSICGRTLFRDGTPGTGAVVLATNGGSTRSDRDGHFVLHGLAPGRCTLHAEVEGHVSVPSGHVVVPAGEAIAGVDLILDRACFVSGTVSSPSGAPLASARVAARLRTASASPDLPGPAYLAAAKMTAATDRSGKFRLGPFVPGQVELSVEHDTHVPFARLCPSDASQLQIALAPIASVSGVVLDHDGRAPAVLERVLLLVGNEKRGGFRVAAELTPSAADAAAGRFHVQVPVPREVRVVAVTRDFAPATSEPFRVPPGVAHGPLELRAASGVRVSGRVRDGSGTPVAKAKLRARGVDAGFDAARVTTTADGAFAFALAPGRHVVTVEKPGFAARHLPIEVVEGQPPSLLDCELARGAVLSGRILATEGASLPALEVLAVPAGEARAAPVVAFVRDGAYTFDHLPPGDYRVSLRERGDPARPAGGRRVQLVPGAVQQEVLLPTDFGLGRLRGVVTREGTCLPFVTVTLERTGRRAASATADRSGRFAFDGVGPGTLSLTVLQQTAGPRLARRTVEFRPGEDRDEDIAVRCGSIAGRVVVASSRLPAVALRVDVFAPDGRVVAATTTDGSGLYRLPMVETGAWTLGISRPGDSTCAQRQVEVAAGRAVLVADIEL